MPRKQAKAQLLHRRGFVRCRAYWRRLLQVRVQTWLSSESKEAGNSIWSRRRIMAQRKRASNTQGRRARDAEDAEDEFMDDELAEQVDGLEIDDEMIFEGKDGRKVISGITLSERVRINSALIPLLFSEFIESFVHRKSNAKQARWLVSLCSRNTRKAYSNETT